MVTIGVLFPLLIVFFSTTLKPGLFDNAKGVCFIFLFSLFFIHFIILRDYGAHQRMKNEKGAEYYTISELYM